MPSFIRTWITLLIVCGTLGIAALSSGEPEESLEGSKKVEFLMQRLEGASDYKVRLAAASALGKIADGTVADWMLRAFRKEDNAAVRLAILYAVAEIPDHRMISPLIELAQQELLSESELRLTEQILWNYRTAFDLDQWKETLLHSPDRSEKALSAWILGVTAGPPYLPALQSVLQDASPIVRVRAVQAIGKMGNDGGKSFCRRAERDEDASVQKAAANCIAVIDLTRRGDLPRNQQHRIPMKLDLYGLQTASVTPQLYRAYTQKNVNPRAVDVAVATLRTKTTAEQRRQERVIHLINREQLYQFFKINVVLITAIPFQARDLERLREAARDQAGYVNHCYVEGLKSNRNLGGTVTVQFKVLRNGSIESASIENATMTDASVQSCILARVKGIHFPTVPINYVTMKYTYSFTPPKDEKFEFSAK